jgi:hypothetical protein
MKHRLSAYLAAVLIMTTSPASAQLVFPDATEQDTAYPGATASGSDATVSGGSANTASGDVATVGDGRHRLWGSRLEVPRERYESSLPH